MDDKLNSIIDTLTGKNTGNVKIFIDNTKYLHSTKPLLCFRMFGVHIHNDTIKFFS